MSTQLILENFDPNCTTMRVMNKQEIDELISKVRYPFGGLKDVIELINRRLAKVVRDGVKDVKLYECLIPVYIKIIGDQFLKSLVDPGTPIGPNTSDAIGQQATQTLLNTFHNTGAAKSGGPTGIREAISISKNQKVLYGVVHFRNQRLKIDDVIAMKPEFIGVSLDSIAVSILPLKINIQHHSLQSEEFLPNSIEQAQQLFDNGFNWWYPLSNCSMIYSEVPRTAIRLKLNVLKLYEFRITTSDICKKIKEYCFQIKISRHANASGVLDNDTLSFDVIPLPSPTFFGIIDLYISTSGHPSEFDVENDFLLQAAVNDFKNINISGFPGIENFYAISKPVTSVVRDVEKAPEGTWVYTHNPRFTGIPTSRFVDLCRNAGIETEAFREEILDYHSHKIKLETRTVVDVLVPSFSNETPQYKPNDYYMMTDNPPKSKSVSRVFIKETVDGNISVPGLDIISFPSKKEISKFVSEINSRKRSINELLPNIKAHIEEMNIDHIIHARKCSYMQGDKRHIVYICFVKYFLHEIRLNVNIDRFNHANNYTKLETILMRDFGIPDYRNLTKIMRCPTIKTVTDCLDDEEFTDHILRILLKTHMPFHDYFDEDEKRSPVDRLISFLVQNVEDRNELDYVYAETKGASPLAIASHRWVNPVTSYSNNFHETFNLYGIEALRNLLNYTMIKISGDIDPRYPAIVADTITNHGINPMTSEGVYSQDRGVLTEITFDNVKKYIKRSALRGKPSTTQTTSTSIFLNQKFNLGTGHVSLVYKQQYGEAEQETRDEHHGMVEFLNEDEEIIRGVQSTFRPGKFPPVPSIINRFVSKDILFYLRNAIYKYRTHTYTKPKPPPINSVRNYFKNLPLRSSRHR